MITGSQARPAVPSDTIFKNDVFKGKVLFCTGGGSGICKGMTEAVMRHGASAFIVGRNSEKLAASSAELTKLTGQKCSYGSADVRDKEKLRSAVDKCLSEFGHIDFVICGAAGNFLSPISGLSENAFRTVMEIDTIGTYNTIKATLPHVQKTRGSYIHVSANLHYRGTPYQAHVSAAKAAVDALSNVLAAEQGPFGVRSNVIAPGPIMETEGFSRLSSAPASSTDSEAAEAQAKAKAEFMERRAREHIPLGRFGSVKDIANATVFLFSDAAAWITGQILAVDGGEMHTTPGMMPDYPENVLDPTSMAKRYKGKL